MGHQQSWPDLSVQISRRRWRCVPDPLLCLSRDGAVFLSELTLHAEVWLVPEFLNILDNWMPYLRDPTLLTKALGGRNSPDDVRDALRIWMRLREEKGQIGGPLYWVRDALRESSLPAGTDESLLWRWEAMAESLDQRLSSTVGEPGAALSPDSLALAAIHRDAAALAAVLSGSILLTARKSEELDRSPGLCRRLESWRVPCHRLEIADDLVSLERGLLLQMLVESGLARCLWGGLRLSVVHLLVPGQFRSPGGQPFAAPEEEMDYLEDEAPESPKDAWDHARVFWYDLTAGGVDARA
jgi:hypothetical protein